VGGASTSFVMLITARACQGAFAALLAPAALGLLTTTFGDSRERGRAFGVYGAIAGGGGLVGLLLGGVLTEYLDWRWCLYVNLLFAGVAAAGAVFLPRHGPAGRPHLDIPGVVTVSGSMFCLVYGLSNAAAHSWHTPSTWGFLAAGVVLLAAFAAWQFRAASPLLPPRVVLDRDRGGAYLAVLLPSMNTGTFGVAPGDAGVASATLNVGQQLGGSIGTALLNTIVTGAAASYLASHFSPAITASPQAQGALQAAAVHGYTTAFWWTAGIFAAGAIVCGTLLRRGPLVRQAEAAPPGVKAQQHESALPARP
jgi:MFS family permease